MQHASCSLVLNIAVHVPVNARRAIPPAPYLTSAVQNPGSVDIRNRPFKRAGIMAQNMHAAQLTRAQGSRKPCNMRFRYCINIMMSATASGHGLSAHNPGCSSNPDGSTYDAKFTLKSTEYRLATCIVNLPSQGPTGACIQCR